MTAYHYLSVPSVTEETHNARGHTQTLLWWDKIIRRQYHREDCGSDICRQISSCTGHVCHTPSPSNYHLHHFQINLEREKCVEAQPWLSSYSHTWDRKTKCGHTAHSYVYLKPTYPLVRLEHLPLNMFQPCYIQCYIPSSTIKSWWCLARLCCYK